MVMDRWPGDKLAEQYSAGYFQPKLLKTRPSISFEGKRCQDWICSQLPSFPQACNCVVVESPDQSAPSKCAKQGYWSRI
jgi:hypothetical protein